MRRFQETFIMLVISDGAPCSGVVTRRNHAAPLPPLLAEATKIPVRRSDHPKKNSAAHFPAAFGAETWPEVAWLLRKGWR